MKYRQKPVEAFQWNGGEIIEPAWFRNEAGFIITDSQIMRGKHIFAHVNDYIIRDCEGNIYRECERVFKNLYVRDWQQEFQDWAAEQGGMFWGSMSCLYPQWITVDHWLDNDYFIGSDGLMWGAFPIDYKYGDGEDRWIGRVDYDE